MTDDFTVMKRIIIGRARTDSVAALLSLPRAELRNVPNLDHMPGYIRAEDTTGLTCTDCPDFRHWLNENRPALVQVYDAAQVAIRMLEEKMR